MAEILVGIAIGMVLVSAAVIGAIVARDRWQARKLKAPGAQMAWVPEPCSSDGDPNVED